MIRRPLSAVLAGILFIMVGLVSLVTAPAAHAEADRVSNWTFSYRVDSDGLLHVTETLTWFFGSGSGRHGIQRTLVTREPHDDLDARYRIDDLEVSSPDAPDDVSTSSECQGRRCLLTVRIGDPDEVITAPSATYTLSYTVSGALRSPDGVDQLYWDVVGVDTPWVDTMDVTVEVPGGTQQLACFSGPTGSDTPCTLTERDGDRAHFQQVDKPAGQPMTIAVGITPGLVANPQPDLVKTEDQITDQALRRGGLTTVVSGLLVCVAGVVMARRRRDEPAPPAPPVLPDTQAYHQPPVTPDLPVAMAGLLMDGKITTRETTAQLVEFAVRGVLTLGRSKNGPKPGAHYTRVRLVDTSLLIRDWEIRFLTSLLGSHNMDPSTHGQRISLDRWSRIHEATEGLNQDLQELAVQQGLIRSLGKPMTMHGIHFALLAVASGAAVWVGSVLLSDQEFLSSLVAVLAGTCMALAGFGYVRSKIASRTQLSSEGSFQANRVRAFRDFLRAGRTDQLRLDPNDDVFSRFLPWAIAVGEDEKWVAMMEELRATGQVPDTPPSWYRAPWQTYRDVLIYQAIMDVERPVTTSSSSSSSSSSDWSFSSSSGSGFSGGFSGGGSGGGGASSW